VSTPESNIDRLLKARAQIDEELRRHKSQLTILFTDVVGSTSYFDRYGDTAGFAMLHRHTELATECFTEYQGTIIKTIGDSVMCEFPEPVFAVRASVELQRRLLRHNRNLPERDRIQLRIGIHSGSGIRYERDVYGDAVNVAARVCKKTGPAQVLISRPVREALLEEKGIRCVWLGKVTFAGKAEGEDIYEVIWTQTEAYNELRQTVTQMFVKGELMSPGLNPEDLILPKRAPTAEAAPTPVAAPAAAPAPAPVATTPPPVHDTMESRYELLGELGSGGMGLVYKARDRETGDLVALKVLKPEIAANPGVMERFKNELRVARRITHKNICRIYDLHRTPRSAFISMEFVEGESLRQALNREQRLQLERGVGIVRQICAGLAEVHAQGIVHRDLKPENVMLEHTGIVKLMDFGIARTLAGGITMTGGVIGTPAYMAPEQAEGKTIDARTDIYALGLVMYEVFTGTSAFRGDTPVEVALKQIRETPSAPRVLAPELPDWLDAAIMRCLEKDPAQRFQSVEDLDVALVKRAPPPKIAPDSPLAVMAAAKLPAPTLDMPAPSRTVAAAAAPETSTMPAPAPPVIRAIAPKAAASKPAAPPPPRQAAKKERPRWLTPAAVVAVFVVGALAVLLVMNRPEPPRQVATQPPETGSSQPASPTAAAPAKEPGAESKPADAQSTEVKSTRPAEKEEVAPAPAPEPAIREPVQVPHERLRRTRYADATYPPEAKRAGITGTVTVEMQLDRAGQVESARAIAGPEALGGAAAEAARQWRYEPHTVAGRPVKVLTSVAVPFTLTPQEQELARLLTETDRALQQGRVLSPADNCAFSWLQQARQLAPNHPDVTALQQRALRTAMESIESSRQKKDFKQAIAQAEALHNFLPNANLRTLRQKLDEEETESSASQERDRWAAQPRTFPVVHRHLSLDRNWRARKLFCSGVLSVALNGAVQYECASSSDPMKRCEKLEFAPGAIHNVEMNSDGSLRLSAGARGNFDFYGEAAQLQNAYRSIMFTLRRR
jgi:TonB family protein